MTIFSLNGWTEIKPDAVIDEPTPTDLTLNEVHFFFFNAIHKTDWRFLFFDKQL